MSSSRGWRAAPLAQHHAPCSTRRHAPCAPRCTPCITVQSASTTALALPGRSPPEATAMPPVRHRAPRLPRSQLPQTASRQDLSQAPTLSRSPTWPPPPLPRGVVATSVARPGPAVASCTWAAPRPPPRGLTPTPSLVTPSLTIGPARTPNPNPNPNPDQATTRAPARRSGQTAASRVVSLPTPADLAAPTPNPDPDPSPP